MLPRLGHHPLIRGNHQHHQVHPPNAGNHGANEFFMAGHVDDAEADIARQVHVGEPQFDGDATLLFFLEAIGIDARKRPDEGCLAVVNVSGGSEN
ncbi:MAG: hypothetical protein A4E69_02263 [Syntrophus sp. PtaB.Bin138]|nr:MAG: hypothetical protein A4E69_02263 [Syntrophus sp. PtaB.Bin138]